MEKKSSKSAAKKTAAPRAKAPKKAVKTAVKAEGTKPSVGRCGGRTCQMADCKRSYKAKGYCGVHYRKWRNGEYGSARYKICSDTNCTKPQVVNRHGYCENHYQSYYIKGDAPVKAPAAAAPAAAVKESA